MQQAQTELIKHGPSLEDKPHLRLEIVQFASKIAKGLSKFNMVRKNFHFQAKYKLFVAG